MVIIIAMTDEKKRIPLQLLYQIDGLEVCCLGIEEEIKEFEKRVIRSAFAYR